MTAYEANDQKIIDLHLSGHTHSQIADILFETVPNPFKLTRDQIRRKVRYAVDKYKKFGFDNAAAIQAESLESLKENRPEVHAALLDETAAAGLNIDDVNYFWYKSENFSINLSSNRKSNDELKTDFIQEINSLRGQITNSLNADDWSEIYGIRNAIHTNQNYINTSGKLLVPSIFDLHIGKLAWGAETDEDYGSDIAILRFKAAINDLLQKTASYHPEQILFPIGNDLFNSDKSNPYAQTTAGTPQQDDVRWQKLFMLGKTLIIEAITKLSLIAPVHVVTVFSNHDHERVFYLGEILSTLYSDNPRITVDNSPKTRKYYQWGKCMIGLAHGHNEPADRLPLLMAQEEPHMWADTHYREWLLGHLHHKKKLLTQSTKDYNGVVVTYLSSLSGTDAWHFQKAYTGSIKSAEAFVYDKREGLVGSAVHNIWKD